MRPALLLACLSCVACGDNLHLAGVDADIHDAPASVDSTTELCAPVPHATQGRQADLTIQRYRIVGASADGKRIAVLYSHIGPSSQDPFANVYGYEEGQNAFLFETHSFLLGGGTSEAAITTTENHALAQAGVPMQQAGIAALDATPVPWCMVGSTIVVGPQPRHLAWTGTASSLTCAPGASRVNWSTCSVGPRDHCVRGATECSSGLDHATVVDVFQLQDVTWVVAEYRVIAIEPLYLIVRYPLHQPRPYERSDVAAG